MSKCPMCNAELVEGARFCEKCGTPVAAPVQETPVAAAPVVEAPVVEAPAVEAPVVEAPVVETPAQETPVQETPAKPKAKKKSPLVPILLGVLGVALVAGLIFVISLFGGKSEKNYLLYVKDKQLYFNDLKGGTSWQVTSKLDDGQDMENSWYANLGYKIGMTAYLSEDGKYLFFPDKLENGSSRFTLYYKSVSDPEADAVKIDSDIVSYTVNEKVTLVTYLKGDERNLYQYDMKKGEKEKIASEIYDYDVTEDGSRIGYVNQEMSVYIKDSGKDKEKMASDISRVVSFDEDLETMYYLKENTLYLQEVGEDKVKIAENVQRVIRLYEDGQIYYATKDDEEEPATLMDYVIDDMAEADAAMQQPVYPTYPDYPSWDYGNETYEEYQIKLNAYYEAQTKYYEDVDKYYVAMDAYYAKQNRDSLRENLAEYTISNDVYTLCFFDGKEEKVVTKNYLSWDDYAYDAPVLIYSACEAANIEKVKLSEVEYTWDVENMVNEAFEKASATYIAVEETATELEPEKEIVRIQLSDDGSVIYYMDNVDVEKGTGEIYTMTVKNGKVGKAELYDDDVYNYNWSVFNGSQLRYFKDYKDEAGDLYIDKTKVDSDVYAYRYSYTDDGVYYFVDWDDEKNQGTLKYWEDGEKTKLGDDVHDFQMVGADRILYLQEYSLKSYKGDLYIWEKGEAEKLDEDVSCVVPIYHVSIHQLGY